MSVPFAYQFAKLTPPNAKVLRRQSVNKGQAYWHFIPNLGIQKWFDFSKAHRVRESEQWYRRGEGVGNQGRNVFSTPAAVPCLCATMACVCVSVTMRSPRRWRGACGTCHVGMDIYGQSNPPGGVRNLECNPLRPPCS